MKELIQNVVEMHRAGFSMEDISEILGCSIELVEETLEFINKN
jgi:uncharacterized protein (DUF433 family)